MNAISSGDMVRGFCIASTIYPAEDANSSALNCNEIPMTPSLKDANHFVPVLPCNDPVTLLMNTLYTRN